MTLRRFRVDFWGQAPRDYFWGQAPRDYVAGTDPTNGQSKFAAKIEMKDGETVVTVEMT